MTSDLDDRRPHILLEGVTETEPFRRGGMGRRSEVPPRDRQQHSIDLQRQLSEVAVSAEVAVAVQRDSGMSEGLGISVEFESFPDIELAFESLARERSGIELFNVRQYSTDAQSLVTQATVFIPDGKLSHFEGLIKDYFEERVDSLGRPRDNRRLIDAISRIRAASLRALWTDTDEFPSEDEGPLWWEVWLPVRGDRMGVVSNFRTGVGAIGSIFPDSSEINDGTVALSDDTRMRVAEGEVNFPERTVLLVYASVEQMQQSMMVLNSIAELRRASETAEFFNSLLPGEQRDWLRDLLRRSTYPPAGDEVPHVCLLDTGVNRGHELLEPALAPLDVHTVEPSWGNGDDDGHGTEMAGLALAGNLAEYLETTDAIIFRHRLESVKLLHRDGANGRDPMFHGYVTSEAVSRPEIQAPNRSRVFEMAVTSRDNRDRGRPSAWSAAVDKLAADSDGQGANRRLMVLSAGNTLHRDWDDYPESNDTDGIHDPAQSWNALTVGAYTDLVEITEPDVTDH